MKRETAFRLHIICALVTFLCVGSMLNLSLKTEVSEPNPNQYDARRCEVVEFYPDDADEGFQWVFVLVTGGEYDGNVYEMRRPSDEHFHINQDLEVVFDTACTPDPVDDEPVRVLKPNMV